MQVLRWQLAAAALAISIGAAAGDQPATGRLAKGTRFETPYFVIDSGRPGPTVLVVGGVHGNEPAGARAAGQLRHWPVRRGKLVVVPRANVPALDAAVRKIPGEPSATADLNRCFPRRDDANAPRREPAKALWALVARRRPDWLVDLHEGAGVRAAGSESVGSSIICRRDADTRRMARAMLAAVNATIDEKDRQFVLLGPPADGSLARAAAEQLGAKAMIVETTYKGRPQSLRARQHRLMVHCLLERLKMTDGDVNQVLPARSSAAAGPIRVAAFSGGGSVSDKGPLRFEQALTADGTAVVEFVGSDDIRSGALSQFDVVLFPGGSGSRQAADLDTAGREAVRKFLRAGGGYVGVCAGAYLATEHYSWSLRILNVKAIDTKHWRRGVGVVKIELTDAGRRLLGGRAGQIDIRYANGPILAPADANDLPPATVLAHFRTEMAENGAPSGVMTGTPAAVTGTYGRGRAVIFSPHPEKSDSLHVFVRRAVRWAAGEGATRERPGPPPSKPPPRRKAGEAAPARTIR